MFEGGSAAPGRLPFHFQAHGGIGRLTLGELAVGLVTIDKLELEVSELGTDPGAARAERFQRRRTRLRALAVRIAQPALDERVAQVKKQLAGTGITQLSARLGDGYVSVRARAADGLAAADLSFHVELVSSGAQLRALASEIRVHGHLPTPGPVIADRLLVALTGADEAARAAERPHSRGLCDVELDLVGALLWQVLPPSGWRLPAVSDIELTHVRVARAGIEVAYGPAGARSGELGVGKHALQLAAAHDLMHSVDEQLRGGHLEDAMRGYRALLASGGPDQPLLLERILALAAARPAWFPDGLELARQALGRWPAFAPAHAALASITLAQGDAREAARHMEDAARMASAGGDDDQAALAALAAARLLRVLDPRAATQLYQLALEHDPTSAEAADSLTDRLADEQRWSELVRLVRTRIAMAEPPRAVELHLRLADVFVHQLGDRTGAQRELAAARELAPDDPAVHEMTATILAGGDPAGAAAAWREVARLAELRSDHRTCARAWARLGDLLADPARLAEPGAAEDAWRRSLELDPMQTDALVGLASAAADRNDHAIAAELYERLRGLGLPQTTAARHELALARSLVALGRADDARASLRRATLAGGEPAAEAHAMLAEIADATLDRDHAAAELDTAIASLVDLAAGAPADADRLYTRAAQLAVERATLLDRSGQSIAAAADWQRAHALARQAAPEIARDAARTLLARSGDDASLERRWIDAVLATRPPPAERAVLLVRRADVRRRERFPDLAAALADLHEAVELTEELAEELAESDPADDGAEPRGATEIRRSAYQLEAELFARSGDQRARAQSLAAIARLAERAADRVESEAAAAAAWLAADEPAAALPHGARAHASLSSTTDVPAALRRDVLVTLGEAAWRQRAWPDVIRAYRGLLDDPTAEAHRQTTFRYRLAVAADRTGDAALALGALRPLTDDPDTTRGASPELRSHALRLFADLAERAGELAAAAAALEGFAAIGGESSAAARADAVYRAGELFRRIERGDDAIRCLETALRISDSHLPALDALEVAWRERGDLERVAAILGRKVAATARQPGRQKPLLSRLGDLQDQLGRSDVALATHQRALEIDPMWRPSLRYVTLGLRDAGQVVAAAGGLAQLAGDLHGDHGVDLAIVTRERQLAAEALSELVAKLDDAQLEAVRAVARPALERAALDNAEVAAGLARLRGEAAPAVPSPRSEAETQSGRIHVAPSSAASLHEAAARARAAGKLEDAFATLETANHVSPGDPGVLRELVEIATQLHDHPGAVRHLADLADALAGARRGDALLELADIYYDRLDDATRGRDAMRRAAEAFGSGSRRDTTLRLLAAEAGAHLAWDIAVEALLTIPGEKRTQADLTSLATALMRAGRDADALSAVEAATAAGRFDDDGELIRQIQREIQRKIDLARSLEERVAAASGDEAAALLDEVQALRLAIGQPGSQPLRDLAAPEAEASKSDTAPWPTRTKTKPGLPNKQVPPAPAASRPRAASPPGRGAEPASAPAGPASLVTILDPDQDVRSSPAIALPEADQAARSGDPAIPVPIPDADAAAHRSDPAIPVPISDAEPTARRSSPAIAAPTSAPEQTARRSSPAILARTSGTEQTARRSSPAIPVPTSDADPAARNSSPAIPARTSDADHSARRSDPAIAVPTSVADPAARKSSPAIAVPTSVADPAAPKSSPAIAVPTSVADPAAPKSSPAIAVPTSVADPAAPKSSPAIAVPTSVADPAAPKSSPAIAVPTSVADPAAPKSSPAIAVPTSVADPAAPKSSPAIAVPTSVADPAAPKTSPAIAVPTSDADPAARKSSPAVPARTSDADQAARKSSPAVPARTSDADQAARKSSPAIAVPTSDADPAARRSSPAIAVPTSDADPAARRSPAIAVPTSDADPAARRSPAIAIAVPTSDADPAARRSSPAIAVPTSDADPAARRSSPAIAIAIAIPTSDADPAARRSPAIAVPTSDADPAARRSPAIAVPTSDADPAARRSPAIAVPTSDADPSARKSSPTIPIRPSDADQAARRSSPAIAIPPSDTDQARRSSPAIAILDADQAGGRAVVESNLADAGAPATGVPEVTHDAPSITGQQIQPDIGDGAGAERGAGAIATDGGAPPSPAAAMTPPGAQAPGAADEIAPASSPSRDPIAPSTLGRIKLVSRTVTRPGVGTSRPDARAAASRASGSPSTETDDASGDWQSVSYPELRSGPWLPPGAATPPAASRPTGRRAAAQPAAPGSETARDAGSSSDEAAPPASSATVHGPPDPEAATATASEPRASDVHAAAQARHPAASGPTASQSTANEPADAEATGNEATGIEATDIEATDIEATGNEATGNEATGIEATDIEATDIEATDIEATDIEATDIEATDIEATDIEATDIEATDIEATDIEATDIEATDIEATDIEPRGYGIASSERPTSRIRLSSMPPEVIGEAASEPAAHGVASSERPTSRIRLSSEALAAAERLASKVLTPEPPAAEAAAPAPDATGAEPHPSRRLTAVFPAVTVHGLDPSETADEPPAAEPAALDDGAAAEPRPSRRMTAVYPAVTVPADLDPSANDAAAPPAAPARAAEPPPPHDGSAAGPAPPRRSTAAFPPVLIPPAFPAPPLDGTGSEPGSAAAAPEPASPESTAAEAAPSPRRSTATYRAATVRPAFSLPSRASRPASQPPSPGDAAPGSPANPQATGPQPPMDAGSQPTADDGAAPAAPPAAAVPGSPGGPAAPGSHGAWELPIAADAPDAASASPAEALPAARGASPPPADAEPAAVTPSVTITGTPEETQLALLLAAASADRERLFAARRADPDDPAVLLALLAHLGDREPAVRRELLDEVARTGHGRALAIALHELALLARESRDPLRATALWTRAYETDPTYPPVWMPLADAFAASDDYAAARELYEMIARSDAYDSTRREFAAERAEALGRDASIVSGEIAPRAMTDLEEAEQLAAAEDWPGALDAAERAVAARPDDLAALEMLERIYFASGNVTAASDAVGRQLMLIDEPATRAALWRRRARMYRETLGRDAEAYRCLKEAHACSPADPEIAYQLRTAAMVRGEWQLAASLMYREIAAAAHPRDRGALHLELAMIYEERLADDAQAQANFEQALAFDPTIPAVKLPLARRYEAIGRTSEAARLYEEAAGHARPADRAGLLEAAARSRQAAADATEPDLAAQLDRAEAAGDLDAALELANQLWRAEPGHPAAFRALANMHRASGDLAALTELTSQRVRHAETADERATAWLEVARLAEEIGALDQAARAYDLALIEDPGHISALDARGALAFRLADFATADLIYRDLGSGESVLGDDELALRRSIIAEHLGRDSEALQLAQLAASLAPGRRDSAMRVQELATRVGELSLALAAARQVLELIPLDDDEAQLAVRFALVELLREAGQLDDAVAELEMVLRDHPVHAGAIETLAHVHMARGDWMAATRYLYQLVPLAPSPIHRAERLYQLGEAVLVHVNDVDRADDVFLRASDLDPSHVPTLRRLLDVYWRADDPGGIVEVAAELADKGALVNGPTSEIALARALVAAALVGDIELAQHLQAALGDDTSRSVAEALAELVGRTGRLQLGTASTAVAELARRGYLDLAKLRAAMAETAAANTL